MAERFLNDDPLPARAVLFVQQFSEMDLLDDKRCNDALDLLEEKRLPDGGWSAEGRYYTKVSSAQGPSTDYVDWSGPGRRKMNPWVTADALAELAERTNVPTLEAVDARLEALRNVPPEYRPLVNDAREYLRLRCQSWRLRAAAIRRTEALRGAHDRTTDASSRLQAEARFKSHMVAQGNAEGAERASLDAFQRIRPNVQ